MSVEVAPRLPDAGVPAARPMLDYAPWHLTALGTGSGESWFRSAVVGGALPLKLDTEGSAPLAAFVAAFVPFLRRTRLALTGQRAIGIMHTRQRCEWHTPPPPAGVVGVIADLVARQRVLAGTLLHLRANVMAGTSRWAVLDTECLVRGVALASSTVKSTWASTRFAAAEPVATRQVVIDRAHVWGFAETTGDTNPIHLEDRYAHAAGLEGIVIHGTCGLGLAMEIAALDAPLGCRVRLAEARFSRPLYADVPIDAAVYAPAEDPRARLVVLSQERRVALRCRLGADETPRTEQP